MRSYPSKSKESSTGIFRWVDTPWTVAAVLGIWGVMIGLEQFLAADALASVAAILAVIRLSKETLIWTRRRHTFRFASGISVIILLVVTDLWWTGNEKSSAEAKAAQLDHLGEIPKLQRTIQEMTKNAQESSTAQVKQQAKMDQKLADIGDDNRSLKSSIEEKDATLAKIAQEQYELNFTPQVLPLVKESPNTVWFMNSGKTNITITDFFCEPDFKLDPKEKLLGDQVTPNAQVSFLAAEILNHALLNQLGHPDGKVPIECHVNVETQDNKAYVLAFTWTFEITDGKVTRSFTIPHPIQPAK